DERLGARARDDDAAHAVIRFDGPHRTVQLGDGACVQRVQLVRTVHGDRRDPVRAREREKLVALRHFPFHFLLSFYRTLPEPRMMPYTARAGSKSRAATSMMCSAVTACVRSSY